MVLIKGKTLSHKIYEINVEPETKISVVKEKFSEVLDTKLNMYDYKLIHLGKVMDDNDVITEDYDSKLFIIMTTKKKIEEVKQTVPNPTPIQPLPNIKFSYSTTTTTTNNSMPSVATSSTSNIMLPQQLMGSSIASVLTNMLNNSAHSNSNLVNELQLLNTLFSNPGVLGLGGQDASNNILNSLMNMNPEGEEDEDNAEEEEEEEHHDDEDENNVDDNENVDVPELEQNNNVPSSDVNYNVAMVGNFSQKDVDNINEIVEMGFDYYEVIQMYTASGKSKEDTLNLLFDNH